MDFLLRKREKQDNGEKTQGFDRATETEVVG